MVATGNIYYYKAVIPMGFCWNCILYLILQYLVGVGLASTLTMFGFNPSFASIRFKPQFSPISFPHPFHHIFFF